MLDAGKERNYIKHIPIFENKEIVRLLKSPNYIGRFYSDKNDLDKYNKNKQICKLIDEIRYYDGMKKIKHVKRGMAKLNNSTITERKINGGGASAEYSQGDKLDLGNAQNDNRLGPVFIPHVDYINYNDEKFYTGNYSANILYNFTEPKLNGGNARTYYDNGQQIDLGGASYS